MLSLAGVSSGGVGYGQEFSVGDAFPQSAVDHDQDCASAPLTPNLPFGLTMCPAPRWLLLCFRNRQQDANEFLNWMLQRLDEGIGV